MIRPRYYTDKHGSLYKVAVERNWNAYEFDCAKRLDRAEKKGNFVQDIEKTITVIQLMQVEQKPLSWIRKLYRRLFVTQSRPSLLIVLEQRGWNSFVFEIMYELERGNYETAIDACLRYQKSF